MPLPTSDFHKPVCLEMRTLKNTQQHNLIGFVVPAPPSSTLSHSYGPSSTITLPLETPLRYATVLNSHNNINNNFNEINNTALSIDDGTIEYGNGNNYNNKNNGDLASVDSSDTYASCQTHPFLSQGDLTSDVADEACALDIDMNNLYINPMEKDKQSLSSAAASSATPQSYGTPMSLSTSSTPLIRSQVKKSASGDTALRSLGTSPIEEVNFQNFDVPERGSRVSLNESPVPKHRKTRFQQSVKPRARFEDLKKTSQESLGETKKRKSSFMPAKSLASATKLINQHLFGIQNIGSKAKFESRHSSSIDSIDASPNLEHHRRSKSILKNKSEASKISTDPESERLLADNMSGSGLSDNGTVMCESGSDYSPNKIPHTFISKSVSPPPLRHRILSQQRSGPASLQSKPTKFQIPRYPEEKMSRHGSGCAGGVSGGCGGSGSGIGSSSSSSTLTGKSILSRCGGATSHGAGDHMTGDGRLDSVTRDSSLESETAFITQEGREDAYRGDGGGSNDENRLLLYRGNSYEKTENDTAS